MRRLLPALLLLACGEPTSLTGHQEGANVHPAGWAEANGHALTLRTAGYPLEECAACHPATDPGPGNCVGCHEQGVDACETCHSADGSAFPRGAHTAHATFECGVCHAVPGSIHTEGHVVDRGDDDVRLSGLAAARGFTEARYTDGSCQNTACHAGPGADQPAPEWAAPAATNCGTCHGAPPPDHANDRCDRCHMGVDPTGQQLLDPSQHLDGIVQAVDWRSADCDTCHGANGDPALDGQPDPGAHAAHLTPENAAPVACVTCHAVPIRVDAPGHLTDDATPGVAEVRLTGAGEGAAYLAGRCSDTTCHGGAQPQWTGEALCGSCHGLPPAADHPADDTCERCHLVAGPDQTIALATAHVDGRLDIRQLSADDCATCHAADAVVAPGGSHAGHARFDCTECHSVPDSADVGAHLDGVARTVLRRGGRHVGGLCSDSTCHGIGQPTWGSAETVDGCGACHGAPPAGHADGACTTCHADPAGPTHVDGRLQVTLPTDCGACHGNPPDTGAHRAHLAGTISQPVACSSCHTVPADVRAPGHLDPSPAEVTPLGGRYENGGCADTACHAGRSAAQPMPSWQDGPQAAECGACHGLPPQGHPRGNCAQCHGAVIDAAGALIRPWLHVNGEVDFR
jgi:predicted CxxxxCH...CXXCH cytochrome family protein